MHLYIQDPMDQQAPVLHERILEACEGATHGAGAFAFVSSEGVELLIRDEVFKTFATNGSFDMIVGVDEITNVRALKALEESTHELPGLKVRVFYHELPEPTFHPKFCWFRHDTKAFLIAGSGNLTAKGLRRNWEAFVVAELDIDSANALEAQWVQWMTAHASRLRTLDDTAVLARAALNVRQRRPSRDIPAHNEEHETEEQIPAPPRALSVLVAEIPRAANRWNQANFSLEIFRSFFGAEPGTSQRVVFQHVDVTGSLGRLEIRPSVAVRSQNFRFELEAAAGLPYPDDGRPIAVFVRIAPRTFRYRLLMPQDPHYAIVSAFLGSKWTGPSREMRRITTTTDEVHRAWPESPLWIQPLEIED